MHAAVLIALHHLRRMFRSPGLILVLMAIPLTIAGIEYAAFGRSVATGKLPPVKVLVLDEDRSFASGFVKQFFSAGPAKDRFEVSDAGGLDGAREQFSKGNASALIVIPKGFQKALLEGRQTALMLYKNPTQSIYPEVADSALDIAVSVGNGLIAQARQPLDQLRKLSEEGRGPTDEEVSAISTATYRAGERLAALGALQGIAIEVERPARGGERTQGGSPMATFFGTVFPGLVLFALLFISEALALRLLRDRTRGLQRRLSMAGVPRGAIAVGGVIYVVAGLLAILALLGLVGHLLFAIEMRSPASLAMIGLGFALFAAGLQMAIASLARSERGVQAIVGGVVMLLSLIGGSFVPLDSYPPFLRAIALLLPNGAAQRAMVDLIVNAQPFAHILPSVATVWCWGISALAVAVVLDRRRRDA